MKSKFRKLATMLLAALMACGMVGTAMAANDALPTDTGTLTIHKYLMDDVTQAGGPNDGNEAGTNGNPAVPGSATPLTGINFDVYKVTIPTSGADEGKVPVDGDYAVNSMTNATTLTSGGVTFSVAKVTTLTTNAAGEVTSGNLEKGYYLVIEQPDMQVTGPAAPFVVAVPMTQQNAAGNTEWIQNVHVYPKNEDMHADKTPSVTSVKLGETVTWTVQSSVPTDIAASKKFDVVDAMDEALTYTAGTTVVQGLASTTAATGTALTEGLHWNVAVDGNNQLTVTFTEDGRKELANYKAVKITFDTTVNAKILERADHSVTNQAHVEYTNRYDQDKTEETPETNIHTGSIAIEKTDANTGKGLAGAEFQIASSEDNAKEGKYLKKTADGKIVDYGETGYDSANAWIETTAGGSDTTPAIAKFEGLKDYTEAAGGAKTYLSYWLVETKAPAGYNLLAAPVKVDFTADKSTSGTIYTVTSPIKNTTDFTLPQTGGTGTILFTVGGICLIGLAVILIVASRKKAHAK